MSSRPGAPPLIAGPFEEESGSVTAPAVLDSEDRTVSIVEEASFLRLTVEQCQNFAF